MDRARSGSWRDPSSETTVSRRRSDRRESAWSKNKTGPVGLVLTPGSGAQRGQVSLVEIDQRVSRLGIAVERISFPSQGELRSGPDALEEDIRTVVGATVTLADRLGVQPERVALGGLSWGARVCSMAVARSLDAAALVLISYPLHPPGRPGDLRTAHFPALTLPCLFVSGEKDPYATPDELKAHSAAISGDVSLSFTNGGHQLRSQRAAVASIVADWLWSLAFEKSGAE